MKWLTEEEIDNFLNLYDFDIRKIGSARWIDQKCTPDVLCTISDCIIEYVSSNPSNEWFNSIDIWHNQYTINYVESVYKKPNLDEKKARNEYDKFFSQPLEMLAYAHVLEKEKRGNRNFYKICNMDLLYYISIREMNALRFINLYNQKVLKDSGIYWYFEKFFENPNPETYNRVKSIFSSFTKKYTPINIDTECNRIFTKVINPIAFMKHTYGTEHGRVSKEIITLDELMYNRANFRDIYLGKPKGVTRKEYLSTLKETPNENLIKYQSAKAKKLLRKFNDILNDGKSEVIDAHAIGKAINMHHIFPENEFRELSGYIENIIALTPNQHFIEAHPNGNTQIIDLAFQQVCLISKSLSIEKNLKGPEEQIIYSFNKFKYVLSTGLDNDSFNEIEDLDFKEIIREINVCYLKKEI